MKQYAIANRDGTAFYSSGHETIYAAKEALIFAIRQHDPFAHIVEREIETAEEKLQKLSEDYHRTKLALNAAIADLYKVADCKTCGYRGSACRGKTHEDEMDHSSCYKWGGEMELSDD